MSDDGTELVGVIRADGTYEGSPDIPPEILARAQEMQREGRTARTVQDIDAEAFAAEVEAARQKYLAAERAFYAERNQQAVPPVIRLAVADDEGTVYRDLPRTWGKVAGRAEAYALGVAVLELLADLDRINAERADGDDGD